MAIIRSGQDLKTIFCLYQWHLLTCYGTRAICESRLSSTRVVGSWLSRLTWTWVCWMPPSRIFVVSDASCQEQIHEAKAQWRHMRSAEPMLSQSGLEMSSNPLHHWTPKQSCREQRRGSLRCMNYEFNFLERWKETYLANNKTESCDDCHPYCLHLDNSIKPGSFSWHYHTALSLQLLHTDYSNILHQTI